MREADFQAQVIAIAERFGWQVWHVPAPMRWDVTNKAWVPARGGAGLPDLIMLHDDPPRLVFMELKGDDGKLTDRQREFLIAARNVAEQSFAPGELGIAGPPVVPRTIGVFACWPHDIDAITQILRSRVVA
jgi:hypothetical protein